MIAIWVQHSLCCLCVVYKWKFSQRHLQSEKLGSPKVQQHCGNKLFHLSSSKIGSYRSLKFYSPSRMNRDRVGCFSFFFFTNEKCSYLSNKDGWRISLLSVLLFWAAQRDWVFPFQLLCALVQDLHWWCPRFSTKGGKTDIRNLFTEVVYFISDYRARDKSATPNRAGGQVFIITDFTTRECDAMAQYINRVCT